LEKIFKNILCPLVSPTIYCQLLENKHLKILLNTNLLRQCTKTNPFKILTFTNQNTPYIDEWTEYMSSYVHAVVNQSISDVKYVK